VLHYVAVCCSALQCVAVCVRPADLARQFDAASCIVLQYVAACCSVSQRVAAYCSVLQCVAACCSVCTTCRILFAVMFQFCRVDLGDGFECLGFRKRCNARHVFVHDEQFFGPRHGSPRCRCKRCASTYVPTDADRYDRVGGVEEERWRERVRAREIDDRLKTSWMMFWLTGPLPSPPSLSTQLHLRVT